MPATVLTEPTDAPADPATPVEPEPDVVALAADGDEPAPMPGGDGGGGQAEAEPDGTETASPFQRFHIPLMVIEGDDTSDDRFIAHGATRTRDLPLMVMATDKAPHGNIPTSDAEHVGRLTGLKRIDVGGQPNGRGGTFPEGAKAVYGLGDFDIHPTAEEYAGRVGRGMLNGVSIDAIAHDMETVATAFDEDGNPTAAKDVITDLELLGCTIVPHPAFASCYIVLDDGAGNPMPHPGADLQQHEGGVLPDGEALAASAVGVLLQTVPAGQRRCLPCEQGEALVASAGPMEPPTGWFLDPALAELTPLTIGADGRIFGHLAAWGTCHTGISGQCVTPPRGGSYAHYRVGSVLTADGDQVPTGAITLGTGHAPTAGRMSAADVMAHYDNTGTAVADVAAGEDAHGVWVAGAMRPDVTELQVRQLRGSALSGDWRLLGGRLQLVAALAVNTPGFPVPRALAASGTPVALVAAGAAPLLSLARQRASASVDLTVALDPAAVAALLEHRKAVEGAAFRIEQVELRTKARRIREGIYRPAAA